MAGLYARAGNDRVFLAGTDAIGRFAWLRRYGSAEADSGPAGAWITSQGGTLLASSSAAVEPEPGGFWLFEVPTPNGQIEFAPGSGPIAETIAATSAAACITLAEAGRTTTPLPTALSLVGVEAEAVVAIVHEQ